MAKPLLSATHFPFLRSYATLMADPSGPAAKLIRISELLSRAGDQSALMKLSNTRPSALGRRRGFIGFLVVFGVGLKRQSPQGETDRREDRR
jgi:hypothetical protein